MQHLEVSGAVRPLQWSLGVKWLISESFGLLNDLLLPFLSILDAGYPSMENISKLKALNEGIEPDDIKYR